MVNLWSNRVVRLSGPIEEWQKLLNCLPLSGFTLASVAASTHTINTNSSHAVDFWTVVYTVQLLIHYSNPSDGQKRDPVSLEYTDMYTRVCI